MLTISSNWHHLRRAKKKKQKKNKTRGNNETENEKARKIEQNALKTRSKRA